MQDATFPCPTNGAGRGLITQLVVLTSLHTRIVTSTAAGRRVMIFVIEQDFVWRFDTNGIRILLVLPKLVLDKTDARYLVFVHFSC